MEDFTKLKRSKSAAELEKFNKSYVFADVGRKYELAVIKNLQDKITPYDFAINATISHNYKKSKSINTNYNNVSSSSEEFLQKFNINSSLITPQNKRYTEIDLMMQIKSENIITTLENLKNNLINYLDDFQTIRKIINQQAKTKTDFLLVFEIGRNSDDKLNPRTKQNKKLNLIIDYLLSKNPSVYIIMIYVCNSGIEEFKINANKWKTIKPKYISLPFFYGYELTKFWDDTVERFGIPVKSLINENSDYEILLQNEKADKEKLQKEIDDLKKDHLIENLKKDIKIKDLEKENLLLIEKHKYEILKIENENLKSKLKK